jgi:hypothetical protein
VVNLDAARALATLLSSLNEVEEIYLAELRPLPPLQTRRVLSPPERTAIERALKTRENTGLPFWDSVLLELAKVPDAIGLLDEAMMHVSFRGRERPLSWASATSGGLEQICTEFPTAGESSLNILSEVRCRGGSTQHIPMIDFHIACSTPNQLVVTAVAERLFPEGAVLLASGESYHAYGTRLLSETNFRSFLGRALLFAPIIDGTYVAHQLIEGRCALRLTGGAGKSRVPRVIASLFDK